jgi:dTDP-4-dehydrorhamnose reductase
MKPPFLILGKGGQLSSALTEQLGARAITIGFPELDFMDPDFITKLDILLAGRKLEAVINTIAYTQVDKAEGEGRAEAFRINGEAPGILARWCKKHNVPLMHFSTDYVFAGEGTTPHKETEAPMPLNVYGESKLAGERAVMAVLLGQHCIFRTSWLYDAQGRNFFNTMLKLMREKESLNVVCDQIGAPTYAPDLAAAIVKLLDVPEFPSGIYHLAASGETSWHGFAQAIFTLARSAKSGQKSPILCQHVNPILTSEYPMPAKRPLNSRLDCSKVSQMFAVTMPDWRQGLTRCFEKKYEHTKRSATGT